MNAQFRLTHIAFVVLLAAGIPAILHGGEKPRSNEELMVDLSHKVVDDFCADVKISDTTTITLNVENGEVNRFFSQPLIESFRQHFVSLYTHNAASSIDILVSTAEVGVTYGEPFSEGYFSARKTERTVELAIRLTVAQNANGKILWAGTKKSSFSDTVNVDEISKLRESSKRIAIGAMPDRSVLERFFEPLIIVGAAGVAVYLFFTIRS